MDRGFSVIIETQHHRILKQLGKVPGNFCLSSP